MRHIGFRRLLIGRGFECCRAMVPSLPLLSRIADRTFFVLDNLQWKSISRSWDRSPTDQGGKKIRERKEERERENENASIGVDTIRPPTPLAPFAFLFYWTTAPSERSIENINKFNQLHQRNITIIVINGNGNRLCPIHEHRAGLAHYRHYLLIFEIFVLFFFRKNKIHIKKPIKAKRMEILLTKCGENRGSRLFGIHIVGRELDDSVCHADAARLAHHYQQPVMRRGHAAAHSDHFLFPRYR